MLRSIFAHWTQKNQNQLFTRARWRLATWYAGTIGVILVFSGLGVYHALTYAHRLTINQELESLANELHEILEPILEEPGKLAPAATEILPDLCSIEAECVTPGETKTLQSRKFYLRLLDLDGNLIAVAGQPPDYSQDRQQNLINPRQHPEPKVSLLLHTNNFEVWGNLQVGLSSPKSQVYAVNLRWILLTSLPTVTIVLIVISWWLAGRAMQPIYQSYQLLQQFTADAAHELRTPLAAIRATVESTLMMSNITETETKETLQTIGRQNVRLSNLVADLLILCRMDRQLNMLGSSSRQKTQEQISLVNLVKDIAEDFAFLAIEYQISLKTQILLADEAIVRGDYEQMYRMVSNLVANALQYTPPKGEINLIVMGQGKYAILEIHDSGIGIAEPDLDKIFNRFYRVSYDRSRNNGGSGLGLSIAYAIAQAHQGNIQVESQLGRGSIFTVFLPTI